MLLLQYSILSPIWVHTVFETLNWAGLSTALYRGEYLMHHETLMNPACNRSSAKQNFRLGDPLKIYNSFLPLTVTYEIFLLCSLGSFGLFVFCFSVQVMNEVVVDRGPSPYLTNLEIFCNGRIMTSVQGDGMSYINILKGLCEVSDILNHCCRCCTTVLGRTYVNACRRASEEVRYWATLHKCQVGVSILAATLSMTTGWLM